MAEAPWGRAARWLTVITVGPEAFGADREAIRLALEAANIEARPVWKPMHLDAALPGAGAGVGWRAAGRLPLLCALLLDGARQLHPC